MKPLNRKPLIYAYGFDKLAFLNPADVETDQFLLRFVEYRSTESLTSADGTLILSGIFETFERRSQAWQPYTVCQSDEHRLAEREKQVFNAWESGGWTCFLLRKLNNGDGDKWAETDLAKKMANQLFNSVQGHDPIPHVYGKADEFRDYFKTYGIARTSLGSPKYEDKTRILAASAKDRQVFAAEFGSNFFFLPLKSLDRINEELVPLLTSAVTSVLSYKQRNDVYLPQWVEDIRFKKEDLLDERAGKLEQELIQIREESALWRRYKGILTFSGRGLTEIVLSVLRSFFGVDLHSKETYVEDAIIYDGQGNKLFVVEIKGVNGGIKRDHINQIDSHRERLELPPSVLGLLIINDFADVPSAAERKKKQIDPNHLELATKQNVRILRTTTLLDLMLAMEDTPQRTVVFIENCLSGTPLVQALPT